MISILIINPNTAASMTESLKSVTLGAIPPDVNVDFITAPSDDGGILSINSPSDAQLSAEHCFPHLQPLVDSDKYDGFLVACYSEHPLVGMLAREIQNRCKERKGKEKKQFVMGIFEASVIASLGLLLRFPPEDNTKFGIVSTGSIWESALSKGVNTFLAGSSPSIKFAGVETTGLSAIELHDLPAEQVRDKMAAAASRLVDPARGRVRVVCLGCAGMSGLENAIREGVVRMLGEEEGSKVQVVDGVISGVQWLIGAVRAGF